MDDFGPLGSKFGISWFAETLEVGLAGGNAANPER